MNEQKIKELFSNEEYVAKLFESGSYEAAADMLAEEGIEVAPDELKKALELARKKADGELSDEDLEDVAGGGFFTLLFGPAIIGAIAGTGVYLYSKYNDCSNC